MASKSPGGNPAHDAAEQYLKNNPSWHEVSTISNAIGFSHGHTLSVCKTLAQDPQSPVEGRKNHSKRVMGYIINGDMKVPGDDRQQIIDLIRRHGNSTPNFSQMSLDDLYDHLRHNVASDVIPLESKWEFRVP